MASKFDKAKVTEGIKAVAQASNEKANLITIKYYKDEDLLDYPKNNEDVTDTEDIEKSIEEQGFTDPIEITDFGMVEGKWMIVSGHRRRIAGRNKNMKEFPCILRHFKSEAEVRNYVLFSNSQRDSSKDPLLFAKRYKMHEEYLKEIGFKGSVREEIARRMGLKHAQADRYNQLNKVILPIWDMIREGAVGISSVTDSGLYTHTPEEQEEVLQIMKECLENENELTRPTVTKIVKSFREGKKTWLEVIQIEMSEYTNSSSNVQAGVSVMNVNTEPTETESKEPSPLDRNNEVNYDFSHREGLPSGVDPLAEERLTDDDKEAIEKASKNGKGDKPQLSEEEKKLANGEKISSLLGKIENTLNDFYEFKDKETALTVMNTMSSVARVMFAEMERIADEYEIEENKFAGLIKNLKKDLESYKH